MLEQGVTFFEGEVPTPTSASVEPAGGDALDRKGASPLILAAKL